MAINLIVQADIIDIKVDAPQPDDIFLVDTNVWFWQTYSKASISSPSSSNKISEYTRPLAKV